MTVGDTLVLRGSRRKVALALVVSLAFVLLGLVLVVGGHAIGWLPLVFFGLGLLAAIAQLIVPNTLVVTPTTITCRSLLRRQQWDLASCSEFIAWRDPTSGQSVVVFNHPNDASKTFGGMFRKMSGHTSGLMDMYGLPTAELIDRLNRARAASIATGAEPSGEGA